MTTCSEMYSDYEYCLKELQKVWTIMHDPKRLNENAYLGMLKGLMIMYLNCPEPLMDHIEWIIMQLISNWIKLETPGEEL